MESIISISHLSKRFSIGGGGKGGLRHWLEEFFRKEKDQERGEFWALRDINLEIGSGDVVGIVGPNGAGKSTLLKILSRITPPTKGQITLRGRVGSLLEVGTGFHPELTGRENIYLNGAILGMRRAEIKSRFDEIVAFAEVDQFLDMPVKRYSSGMYVRLAFAVAAHLQPEILLVDEVLAVGDAAFQKKCLGKMDEVSHQQGRTIVFVSHNMAAVNVLCKRAIYLRQGKLILDGTPSDCIARYFRETFPSAAEWKAPADTKHPIQVKRLRLLNAEGRPSEQVEASNGFIFELEYEVRKRLAQGLVELWLHTSDGVHLMTLGEHDATPSVLENREPGKFKVRARVPGNLLNTGIYYVRINSGIAHQSTFDHCEALRFEVVESHATHARGNRKGLILPLLKWEPVEFDQGEANGTEGLDEVEPGMVLKG